MKKGYLILVLSVCWDRSVFTISGMLAFLLYGCITPFEPPVGAYNSALVIDGVFTDSGEPSTVTLSRSFALSARQGEAVKGAEVIIESDQGEQTVLREKEDGVYQTNPTLFKGQAGKRYRLLVETPEGDRFESEWELMKAAPPIGDIDFAWEERIPDDPNKPALPGIQFYLNTSDAEKNTRFYNWELITTHEFALPLAPQIRVEFGSPPFHGNDEIIFISEAEAEGYRCWRTDFSRSILIASTDNLTEDIISDFPIHFVDVKSPRLSFRYSLLIKQYAISEAYYEYLKLLEETNETTGSIFDPTPTEVFGNLKNSDGKALPVLGYFRVAGLSEKRIFVNRDELPLGFTTPSGPVCKIDTIDLDFIDLYTEIEIEKKVLYNYYFLANPPPGEPQGFLLTDPICTSCALNEATNERPDFW